MRHQQTLIAVLLILALLDGSRRLAADELLVKPLAAAGPLDNPLKGWCPYTDAGEIHQPYSMVFLYVPWSKLEPKRGDYQFEAWEKSWNVERAKGKHIIFRVYIDYPSLPSGLPDWLRKFSVKEKPYKDHGGGLSPDYNNPIMIAAMERLIGALGKRYNNHPRIAFIQLGLLGFWGEWHTWPRDELYATPQTERRIIDAYRKAFPNKSLMIRYARDYGGQQPWIGFHDDMFPQDTDNGKNWSFLSGLRGSGRTDNWKVAVVGGEMVPNKASQWLGTDYQTTMTMMKRAHFTWIGPYCPALQRTRDEEFLRRSQTLVRKMGYQFQLTEFRHPAVVQQGESVQLQLRGMNTGVAPFYYPWAVEFALIDSADKVVSVRRTKWNIREWRPGQFTEKTALKFDVPAGEYRLAVGVRDPWLDRPAIKFANQLKVIDGWTVLSTVKTAR